MIENIKYQNSRIKIGDKYAYHVCDVTSSEGVDMMVFRHPNGYLFAVKINKLLNKSTYKKLSLIKTESE